jgi:hypothetical protein
MTKPQTVVVSGTWHTPIYFKGVQLSVYWCYAMLIPLSTLCSSLIACHLHPDPSLRLSSRQHALDNMHDAEQLFIHERLAHELDVRRRALDSLGVVCAPPLVRSGVVSGTERGIE